MTPYIILDDPSLVTDPLAPSPIDARAHDDELDDVNKHDRDTDEEYIDLLRAVFMPAEQAPSSPIDEGYADFLKSLSDGQPAVEEHVPSPTIEELWSEVINGGGGGENEDVARLGIDELLDGGATNDDDIDTEAGSESDDGSFAAFVDNLHKEGGVIRLPVVVDGDAVESGMDRGDPNFDAFLAHIHSRQQQRGREGSKTNVIDNFDFLPRMQDGGDDTVEAVWSRIVSGMSDAPAEPPSWFWSWFGHANNATASSGSEAEAEAKKKLESKGGDDDTVASEVESPPSWFGSWWYGVQPMEVRREVDPAEQEESFV